MIGLNSIFLGALYDRAFFPGINEIRAVIDRAYKCGLYSAAPPSGPEKIFFIGPMAFESTTTIQGSRDFTA